MVRFINFLLYQTGWFFCVLGAAWHFPWLGTSIALSLLVVHFWLATDRAMQLKLALSAAAVGLVIDTAELGAGVFVFPQGAFVPWLPPPWMSVLWMQFATTLQYSMRWMSGRYALSPASDLWEPRWRFSPESDWGPSSSFRRACRTMRSSPCSGPSLYRS